jgi:hypothetical protein
MSSSNDGVLTTPTHSSYHYTERKNVDELIAEESYVSCLYSKRNTDYSWRDFNWRAGGGGPETILFSSRPKSSTKRNKAK